MYAVDSGVKYLYALGESWVLRVVLVHGQLDVHSNQYVHLGIVPTGGRARYLK